jgi:hypothetical protein
MSRKRKNENRIIGRPAGIEVPQPRRYVPKPCSMCTALRPNNAVNYSEVYTTKTESSTIVRYCRCKFCSNTWKEIGSVNGSHAALA